VVHPLEAGPGAPDRVDRQERGPRGRLDLLAKKTSALVCDIGQAEVRAAGLASGIVDYKVCAIDPTWSGLRFARRRPDKAKP